MKVRTVCRRSAVTTRSPATAIASTAARGRDGDGADQLRTVGDGGGEVERRPAAGRELLGGRGQQERELGIVGVQGGRSDGDRGLSQGGALGLVRLLVGAPALPHGEDAEHDGDGERGGDGARRGAEDAVGAGLAAYLLASRAASASACAELATRNTRSTGASSTSARSDHATAPASRTPR